jgi:hypothetical protein
MTEVCETCRVPYPEWHLSPAGQCQGCSEAAAERDALRAEVERLNRIMRDEVELNIQAHNKLVRECGDLSAEVERHKAASAPGLFRRAEECERQWGIWQGRAETAEAALATAKSDADKLTAALIAEQDAHAATRAELLRQQNRTKALEAANSLVAEESIERKARAEQSEAKVKHWQSEYRRLEDGYAALEGEAERHEAHLRDALAALDTIAETTGAEHGCDPGDTYAGATAVAIRAAMKGADDV